MKKLGSLFLVVLAAALFLTLPAAAAPKALSEAEMDLVTAAGQPEVLIAGDVSSLTGVTATGTVTLTGDLTFNIVLGTNAQANLRALILNNVVGENAVATGVNIQATNAGGIVGSQSNDITQSWGSTIDIGFAPGADGGAVGKCIFASCGNASEAQRLSIYSDEILIGLDLLKDPTKDFELILGDGAQSGLLALVVNNVVGINLVASGVNIASGRVLATTLAGGIDVGGTSQNVGANQSNTITQYRGTPFSRP
jgi:hypothetical protein